MSINVLPVNNPPTADAQSATTAEDAPITITLTGSDGNPGLDQVLTYSIVTQPAHGTVQILDAHAGTVTYTPSTAYNGPDSFAFRVTDDDKAEPPSTCRASPATVSMTVTPVNRPPIATPQTVAVTQNSSQAIVLTGDDNDPEVAQVLTYTLVAQPTHGTLSGFDPATGAVTYTPATDYSGPDSFTFTVTDDAQAGPPGPLTSTAGTVTLNVGAVNNPPVAFAQSVATSENAPVTFTLTGDDGDPEVNQVLHFTIVQGPSLGTITSFDPATGRGTYVPSPYRDGSDSFTFTVTDDAQAGTPANLTSPSATVSIQIARIEYPPVFQSVVGPLSAVSGQTIQTGVTAVDPNIPSSPIVYSIDPNIFMGATIDPQTGVVTVTIPQDSIGGTVQIVVRATKQVATAPSATQTLDINVIGLGALLLKPASTAASAVTPQPATPAGLAAFGVLEAFSTAASAGSVSQMPLAFGPSDLLEPTGFFSYAFAPDRGGSSGSGVIEAPEVIPPPPGLRISRPDGAAGGNPASQDSADGSHATDGSRDKPLRDGQTRVASPALNDAAIEEYTDGGEWVDVPDQVAEQQVT